MPASASALSSSRPAGPTNGSPLRSSWSPGCSPTNTTRAVSGPSPNTVWVAGSHSSQARQPAAAVLSPSSPTPDGGEASPLRSLIPGIRPQGGRSRERLLPRLHVEEPDGGAAGGLTVRDRAAVDDRNPVAGAGPQTEPAGVEVVDPPLAGPVPPEHVAGGAGGGERLHHVGLRGDRARDR